MQPPSTRLKRFAAGLVRWHWGCLAVVVVVSVLLWGPASRLKLEESIESFYAPTDPLLTAYLESKQAFGGDEFVLVAYQLPQELAAGEPIPNSELTSLGEFSEKLSAVPGVNADSTQDLQRSLRNPDATGIFRVALRLPATERAVVTLLRRILIGDDNQTVAVVLRLQPEDQSPAPRAETFRKIRELAAQHTPPAYVAGEPVQIHDMFRYVEQDNWVLGLASSGLLMLVILVIFRNLRWVLLPVVIIHVTLLWTKGLLALSGLELSMVSSMLTSLMTVICIATTMHITVTYREFRRAHPREEAFIETFADLAAPVFWVTITTAIGFAALLTTTIVPVRSFAIMMGLGTMLVLVTCLLLIPPGILLGKSPSDPGAARGEAQLSGSLEWLAFWCDRRPLTILAATTLIGLFFAAGLRDLQIETNFTKNFREQSPIVQSVKFFEDRLGGVGTWEVSFPVEHDIHEVDLTKVQQLAEDLRNLKLPDGSQLTKVLALTDGLALVPRMPEERSGGLIRVPRFHDASLDEQRQLLALLQPEMEPSLYNQEQGRMRIVLRALEMQPAEVKLKLIAQVEETARKHYPEAKTTGLYVLLAYLITTLLGDQLVSFLISTVGVTLCMWIAFRSWRVALISLAPNILPNLLVIGGMGWTGLPINIGTAMISSVAMGLTVDSTILYLYAYDRARQTGSNHLEALRAANGGAGLALTLANIALVIGFSALALSNFVPLAYFGVLVSIAMLGGLICNLVLLPVLLHWAAPDSPRATPQAAVAIPVREPAPMANGH